VSTKMSLELIPCDGVDIFMGVTAHLLIAGGRSIELEHGKKDFLVIHALGDHALLLNGLEPIINIYRLHHLRKGRRLSALEISKPIPQWWWRCLRLSSLHVDHGLLLSLKHLCLHHQQLLKSRWRGWRRVDILVVLSVAVPVVVVVAVPCIGHLKYKY
jgi:hypothetical protein